MRLRTLVAGILIVVVSALAAFLFNEMVPDAQHERGTGRNLACRDPRGLWEKFERCRGQEEHLFWVAGLTAIVAAGTAALGHLITARGTSHRSSWIGLAALLAFVGVVLWGFLFEIESLPPEFH